MSNKKPFSLPNIGIVNDDEIRSPLSGECAKAAPELPLITAADQQLSEFLRQLGRDDAAELARPIRLLGNFKPGKMIDDLKDLAEQCGGNACLVLVRKTDLLPEMIWSYDAGNGVNRLVNCRANGGWVLGTLEFRANDEVTWHAGDGEEKELYDLLLGTFARAYVNNQKWEATEELLALADKPLDSTTLDKFSDWQDKHGSIVTDIHAEIISSVSTENGQVQGEVTNAR